MNEYQTLANRTDQHPLAPGAKPTGPEIMVPLLGLAGEAGGLLSEYKKYLRDGESHRLFTERVVEELGDLLWYVANVATKFGLTLSDVATRNVEKCCDRWDEPAVPAPATPGRRPLFDERYPPHEQLPRRFVFAIEKAGRDGRVGIRVYIDGVEVETKLGELSDNAYEDDGYRFHDVFHVAYGAILGWSPIIRSGLRRKRKSNPKTDEVEDGGRATAIEEGVSALVFSYAAEHNFLDGAEGVSYELLRVVKSMTAHLEVSRASARDWERAIVRGFEVWRAVKARGGGAILADLAAGTIELVENPVVVSA